MFITCCIAHLLYVMCNTACATYRKVNHMYVWLEKKYAYTCSNSYNRTSELLHVKIIIAC